MNLQDVIATFGSVEKARERIEDICEHTDDEVEAIVGLALLGLDSLAAADPEREAKAGTMIGHLTSAALDDRTADVIRWQKALLDLLRPAPPSPSVAALREAARGINEMLDDDGKLLCGMIDFPFRTDEWKKRWELFRAALAASNANAREGE